MRRRTPFATVGMRSEKLNSTFLSRALRFGPFVDIVAKGVAKFPASIKCLKRRQT